jgi:hypothetical protein
MNASRNQREGRYAGACQGRHVRRLALVPPLTIGGVELFPAFPAFADSSIAWITLNARDPRPLRIPLHIRYRSKDAQAVVTLG